MKLKLKEILLNLSFKKIHDIVSLCIGIIFFLFSINTIVFHVQYNSLPHIQSLTTIAICSFLQGIIIILSSLLQILHTTHKLPTSMPFHYFTLFIIILISVTHSIILMVSIHQFNRINDSSNRLNSIETQYSCCGWYSFNTMICKSLAGIRADRTCFSTVGSSFQSVLPTALVLNIIEIVVSISHIIISYVSKKLNSTRQIKQLEETEDPADIIVNYLNVDEDDESDQNPKETTLLQPDNFLFSETTPNRSLLTSQTTESEGENDNSNMI